MLDEWFEQLIIETAPIPIEQQAKKLSLKYEVKKATIKTQEYNSETTETETVDKEVYLVCFKSIICKYRPHLHLGDYWLYVRIIDGIPNYHFYYPLTIDDKIRWENAEHPHLSNGKPCLGSHQGDIADAIISGNFMRFFSQVRAYLSSYYGRSTYTRGVAYKKTKLAYTLYSNQEIYDMFSTEYDEPDRMDVRGLAEDPIRWNWPKEIPAWGKIEVQGQELRQFQRMLKVSADYRLPSLDIEFPFISEMNIWKEHLSDYASRNGAKNHYAINKIMGYVFLCMTYGEMSLLTAVEFVRIFLIKLYLDYTGCLNSDLMDSLSEMSISLNRNNYGNTWQVNSRYKVVLDHKRRDEASLLRTDLSKIIGDGGTSQKFIKELKYAGHKLSNFMILLRKHKPENATATGYLVNQQTETIDFESYTKRYRSIEKFVLTKAMQQLEKDKRRFVNELNKPDIIHIESDDGQATLFSENV